MGGAKRWMEEQQERGWWSIGEKYACQDCVEDEALVAYVSEHAVTNRCEYCGQESDQPIAAPVDGITEVVHSGLSVDHNNIDHEGVPYETREGGWQADALDTSDLLFDEGPISHPGLFDDLVSSMSDTLWVQRDYWRLRPSEALSYEWDRFRDRVMHHRRFLFAQINAEPEDGEDASPLTTLTAVGEAIRQGGVIRTVPAGTSLWRAQVHPAAETLSGAARLGAPPLEHARAANRMSPAGIVMLYGAMDQATAAAETVAADPETTEAVTIGRFETLRDLRIVDLVDPPSPPSIFDVQQQSAIHPRRFLAGFARDISQEVTRDGAEHIEYVPTQIVTEFLRDAFDAGDGPPLLGVRYASSKVEGGVSIALWVDNDAACDPDDVPAAEDNVWLVLCGVERRTV